MKYLTYRFEDCITLSSSEVIGGVALGVAVVEVLALVPFKLIQEYLHYTKLIHLSFEFSELHITENIIALDKPCTWYGLM